MKSLIACSIFLLMLFPSRVMSTPAQESKGELVKVTYDEQKDVTQVSLNPIILISRKHEELRLGAVTAYQGKVKVVPREIALVFVSLTSTDSNKYEAARKLTVVIDGQRLPIGETKRSKQTQNGLFIETLLVNMPTETFLRMGKAKQVSLKLGFTEVALTPANIVTLRAAGSYMTE